LVIPKPDIAAAGAAPVVAALLHAKQSVLMTAVRLIVFGGLFDRYRKGKKIFVQLSMASSRDTMGFQSID